ncbi:MAG: 2-amino-4-hydroxy-6-hydroxymethyldihydropteridine diphosphokinase [Alphaproteobacteria bacterium]|nr:2-amino-4-hydroxy-6-hydroxymethyldihydropteridine diphosphokinase [Alphaproteobacteria bacterium]
MRVPGVGPPRAVLQAATKALAERGVEPLRCSPILDSAPVGPALRRYANAAILVETGHDPAAMLARVAEVEAGFARRRSGQRWRARTLDIDIILWSGGVWHSADLTIPHPRFRERRFVLGPARRVAPDWVDPPTGASLRQLDARLTRPRALPR